MNKVFKTVGEKIEKPVFPPFKVGDVVRIHRKVKEGDKERTQVIEGVLISHKHGFEPGGTITIRRIASGVAVEMIFPLYSPFTEKIQIVKRQKVRRAKLYYLGVNKGKRSKLKENIEATRRLRSTENLLNVEVKKEQRAGKDEVGTEKKEKEKEEK